MVGGRAPGALGQREDVIEELGRGVALVTGVADVRWADEAFAGSDLRLRPEVRPDAGKVSVVCAGLVAALVQRVVGVVVAANKATTAT